MYIKDCDGVFLKIPVKNCIVGMLHVANTPSCR